MTWAGRRGSRWWNRRTCNLSLLTSASRIHLQMEQFSQSTCWTLVKDFGHLKEQETCPYNQVGWKNKGRKKRSQKRDWQPWWEAEGERKSPHSDSLMVGKSAGKRERPLGDQRRRQWMVCRREDKVRTACMACAAARHIPAWVVSHTCCRVGFGMQTQGGGQLLSLKRQPVGKGVMGSQTGKVCGKCPRHHRSKASL